MNSSGTRDDVMDDCIKFWLYMVHFQRSLAQKKRIGAIMCDVKSEGDGSACVCLKFYKMNLEQVGYRESTAKDFGKKGMSWPGTGIFIERARIRRRRSDEKRQNG